VAVDAMGGDIGPAATIPGVVAALREGGDCEVVLYGDPEAIGQAVADAGGEDLPLHTVSCLEQIGMDESPAAAVRGKPDAPVVRAMRDHREGAVDAVISAGSTGATVAASLLLLGRVGAAERPAIATFVPTVAGQARLRESGLEFLGNVEGNEVLVGACDVLVTDGFTGNIALKLCEGLAQFVKALAGSGQLSPEELAGLGAFGAIIKKRFNYEVYGGAPLLGVDGVAIICHGRSTPLAFTHAVKVAERQVRAGLPALVDRALRDGASGEG
jgi:glycerol-3-phosphate acyltransferase PlsX